MTPTRQTTTFNESLDGSNERLETYSDALGHRNETGDTYNKRPRRFNEQIERGVEAVA